MACMIVAYLNFNYFTHDVAKNSYHTWLTMYYIWPFLYDIINISLRFGQCYFTKYVSYDNCIDAVRKSNQIGTNIADIMTSTLHKITLTKS